VGAYEHGDEHGDEKGNVHSQLEKATPTASDFTFQLAASACISRAPVRTGGRGRGRGREWLQGRERASAGAGAGVNGSKGVGGRAWAPCGRRESKACARRSVCQRGSGGAPRWGRLHQRESRPR
jgi:hypothetical protein